MSQIDLWRKAAECVRAREATTDPHARQMLTLLRTLWVNLANERRMLSETQLADQIEALSLMHAGLIPDTDRAQYLIPAASEGGQELNSYARPSGLHPTIS